MSVARSNYFAVQFFLILLSIFNISSAIAQDVGIGKTKSGYLCFKNGGNLVFTMHVDSSNPIIPYWINENELVIVDRIVHLRYFHKKDISSESHKINSLIELQNYDGNAIKVSHPHHINIINDTVNFDFSYEKDINKWYFITKNDTYSIIHYIVDIKKDDYFIRLEVNAKQDLQFARQAAYYTLESLKFYEKKFK